MTEKSLKAKQFFKKNLYYFVFLIVLTAVTVTAVTLMVSSSKKGGVQIEVPSKQESDDKQGEEETPTNPNPPQEPVVNVIVFDVPVSGTVIKDFTDNTVVYNSTLDVYTGHLAIDFSAEEGTEVYACYGGVVESVTTTYLQGTTVTVDHGNGLKSIYNSIEADENIAVGQTLLKGDLIGYCSTNNRSEYKDGSHLHFEVTENGKKVNPNKYLLIEEK